MLDHSVRSMQRASAMIDQPLTIGIALLPTRRTQTHATGNVRSCRLIRKLYLHPASRAQGAITSFRRPGHVDLLPSRVRVERRDLLGKLRGVRPEVFLEYCAGVIHDEGHYAGVAVFGRISDQGKTSDHLAIHDIVGCAAFRVRSLFGDDLIVVAVIRRTALVDLVALLRRLREELAERALLVALRDRPVKPVLLAGIADEVLGIGARARAGAVLFGVFILSVDIGKKNLDGVELVAADPPVENFAATLRGIEGPFAGLAGQRDRKRIVIVADNQDGFAVAVRRDLVLGVVGFQKTLTDRVVGNLVAGRDDIVAIGTENGKLGVLIVSADGADERRGG